MMKWQFLGTGSVKAAPLFGCDCPACAIAQDDTSKARRPASGLISIGDLHIYVDAGRHDLATLWKMKPPSLQLLTHYHMDHVQGLFLLRWGAGERVRVYSPNDEQGCDDLFKHPGLLDFSVKLLPFASFSMEELTITPIPLVHSKLTLGYVFDYQGKRLAYLCDSGMLRRDVTELLSEQTVDVMILDCDLPPMPEAPRNHNDLTRALDIFMQIKPKQLWLTHISHTLDHYWLTNPDLPDGMHIAYDGDCIEL